MDIKYRVTMITIKEIKPLESFSIFNFKFFKQTIHPSLQPLAFNSTCVKSVENAVLSLPAMASQSCGFTGLLVATSIANAISCRVSGHLNGPMMTDSINRQILYDQSTSLYSITVNYMSLHWSSTTQTNHSHV